MIAIIGPTATGKTSLAAQLAYRNQGEVISADSRQVYRGMDIGTGKDISEYTINGEQVPYHLVDIAEPGEEYNLFRYQQDFLSAWKDISNRNKLPVLCGGTGMYIEAVLKGYRLLDVPENAELRSRLENKSDAELQQLLKTYKTPHNTTDTEDRDRLIRAIEIQDFYHKHQKEATNYPDIDYTLFGIQFDRQIIRKRITDRLKERLESGMIEEVEYLLQGGVSPESLKFYGLEYRFLTQYIQGEISYDELFQGLNTAIHQFAKRQMTWFRRMQRKGFHINWIDGQLPMSEKIRFVEDIISDS